MMLVARLTRVSAMRLLYASERLDVKFECPVVAIEKFWERCCSRIFCIEDEGGYVCVCVLTQSTNKILCRTQSFCLHKMKCFRNNNSNNGVISQHTDKWNWTKYSPQAKPSQAAHNRYRIRKAEQRIATVSDWLTESKRNVRMSGCMKSGCNNCGRV